jgi:hypothetical protein
MQKSELNICILQVHCATYRPCLANERCIYRIETLLQFKFSRIFSSEDNVKYKLMQIETQLNQLFEKGTLKLAETGSCPFFHQTDLKFMFMLNVI